MATVENLRRTERKTQELSDINLSKPASTPDSSSSSFDVPATPTEIAQSMSKLRELETNGGRTPFCYDLSDAVAEYSRVTQVNPSQAELDLFIKLGTAEKISLITHYAEELATPYENLSDIQVAVFWYIDSLSPGTFLLRSTIDYAIQHSMLIDDTHEDMTAHVLPVEWGNAVSKTSHSPLSQNLAQLAAFDKVSQSLKLPPTTSELEFLVELSRDISGNGLPVFQSLSELGKLGYLDSEGSIVVWSSMLDNLCNSDQGNGHQSAAAFAELAKQMEFRFGHKVSIFTLAIASEIISSQLELGEEIVKSLGSFSLRQNAPLSEGDLNAISKIADAAIYQSFPAVMKHLEQICLRNSDSWQIGANEFHRVVKQLKPNSPQAVQNIVVRSLRVPGVLNLSDAARVIEELANLSA